MTDYCIIHQKEHNHYKWRNSGKGWYCVDGKMSSYEFVPQRIKDERQEKKEDIVQPFRQGIASKEFIKSHPDKAKKTFTNEQMKKAQNVWSDVPGWRGKFHDR